MMKLYREQVLKETPGPELVEDRRHSARGEAGRDGESGRSRVVRRLILVHIRLRLRPPGNGRP